MMPVYIENKLIKQLLNEWVSGLISGSSDMSRKTKGSCHLFYSGCIPGFEFRYCVGVSINPLCIVGIIL